MLHRQQNKFHVHPEYRKKLAIRNHQLSYKLVSWNKLNNVVNPILNTIRFLRDFGGSLVVRLRRVYNYFNCCTGSAKMTTSTVAFPGVSKLTSGVNIVSPASFTEHSIAGNWLLGHEKAILPNAVA